MAGRLGTSELNKYLRIGAQYLISTGIHYVQILASSIGGDTAV